MLTMKTFGNMEERIKRLEVVNIKVTSLWETSKSYRRVFCTDDLFSNHKSKDKFGIINIHNLADNRVVSPMAYYKHTASHYAF